MVAPDLSAEHGMVAGEHFYCGNVDDDLSSWPQHPIHLIECVPLHLVVEGVEHVERGDEVELAGRERQSSRGCTGDAHFAEAASVGESTPGDVDPAGAAVAAQHREVVSGAAAAVEDERIAAAGSGALEQRLDEPTESVEPEVIPFGAGRGFEQVDP